MKRSLLSLVLLLAACKTAPEVVADVPPPTLPEEAFTVVTQSLTGVDVKYTGTVQAAGDDIVIEKAAWEFVVDGAVKRSGEAPLNVSGKAGAVTKFELGESLVYVKDEEELKAMDARGGSLLLAMRGTLFIKAGAKTFEVPFAKSKEVRTPRLPHLKFIDFDAFRSSDTEVQAVFHLGVVNPNPFQISITGLDYTAQLAGKELGKGTLGAGDRISPASTGVFDITVLMTEETHGKDAAKIVKSKVVPYVVNATLRAQLYSEPLENIGDIKLTK
ncbi:MAG: LEA type 2 family protein [Archangium sp.]